jgi:DNA topoisomerase-1
MKEKRALKDQKIERVVFNAITKQAVTEAMAHPREIDGALVDAYMARRALDYLVGFTLSPVLWRKLPGARSAGRVQSVALRLVCDRELEIEKFIPKEYWSLLATLATPRGESFEARLVGADGKKITRLDIGTGTEAEDFKKAMESANFTVATVEAKPARRNPQSPFTTSTLQQEASRKLGFAPAHTMRIAQRLYEGIDIGGETTGLITYMRTDGVQIDPSAITQARTVIGEDYGKAYVPDSPRQYTSKAKNAQEAHEAIRPTDLSRRPASLKARLDNDQSRLYELIWMRTVASQMESAEMERTTVDITATAGKRVLELRATGQVVKFDGFLAVYQEGRDDDSEDEDSKRLPVINQGETLKRESLSVNQHFTEPPPRFSEASLVKRMEELGIGRPSTYASILQVLKDRGYVKLEKKRLYGEDKGRVVIAFLENYFARYVEFDFTAALEEQLDRVSNNEISWQQVLKEFWTGFIGACNDIKDVRVSEVLDVLDAMLGEHIYEPRTDGGDPRQCPSCGNGKLNLKAGKFGAFVGCSNYPECRYTRPLAASSGSTDRALGKDPVSGLEVAVKAGRFGPYIQLGDAKDYGEDEKPKRAGIPKEMSPADVELELALKLLSLPREIGKHPEDGEPITAGIGRFGPFVRHIKTYASLEAGDDVYNVGLNRAVTLIAEKILKGPSKRFGADPGTPVGEYPARGGTILRRKGRYGAYVTIDGINATIPDNIEPEKLTLEEAIALIEERAARGGGKPKRAAKKKAAKPKVAKTAPTNDADAAPKAAAKKAAPKKKATAKTDVTEAVVIPVKAKVAKTAKTAPPKAAAAKAATVASKKSAGKANG